MSSYLGFEMDEIQLSNQIIEATEKNADNLEDEEEFAEFCLINCITFALQVAIEQEDEEEVQGLLDRVHQILKLGGK